MTPTPIAPATSTSGDPASSAPLSPTTPSSSSSSSPYVTNGTVSFAGTLSDGQVAPPPQNLNPYEYATPYGAACVIKFLSTDPRTAAWGPFTVVSTNQSNPWWKYSTPELSIKVGMGATFNAALLYRTLSYKNAASTQALIDEIGTYVSGADVESPF